MHVKTASHKRHFLYKSVYAQCATTPPAFAGSLATRKLRGTLLKCLRVARIVRFMRPPTLGRISLSHVEAASGLEPCLVFRANRFFPTLSGGNSRAWLLRIVRNTCYTLLHKNKPAQGAIEFLEELHCYECPTPETLAIAGQDQERLVRELKSLPARFREAIVLRELQGCSYKEIATIMAIPIGTVMSTLSRARRQLQLALLETCKRMT